MIQQFKQGHIPRSREVPYAPHWRPCPLDESEALQFSAWVGQLAAVAWSVSNFIAPDRMQARHDRWIARGYLACDLPLYGLPTWWAGERGPGEISMGHQSFERKAVLGLWRRQGPVVMHSFGLSHRTPEGTSLTVSSHRSGNPDDLRRWLSGNFVRQRAFRAAQDAGEQLSAETLDASVARQWEALRSSQLAWQHPEIAVDGEAQVFDVLEVGDAWIGVGNLEEFGVTINGERFPIDAVSLVRIRDLTPYLAGLQGMSA